MVTVEHSPKKYCENVYTITGDNLEELITECLLKIRFKSKEYYKTDLEEDLRCKGVSGIDVHAGNGTHYIVIWTNFSKNVMEATK